ncbi:hypothetical protein MUBE_02830 [Mycobacterium uberis]|uniref:Uncharacterized protein n=1 Tax=Mycobacterium uberis TaxID=2162698 RepID=A0A3E1HKK8_9MYCO|nr:hypothetical protein [Mycobacterium uberis]RFD26774.1 hypothetical protein MUBE_02830 [Mycobacterium uberis]
MCAQRNGHQNRSWNRSQQDQSSATIGGHPKASIRALAQIIERSSRIHSPVAEAYVAWLRRTRPGANPAEIIATLEKRYLAALTASGAAVGSAATLPGVGTLAAVSVGAGETVFFLEATAVFVLAIASVYGIPTDHRERRRALMLAVLVGDNTRRAIGELIGPNRTTGGWLTKGMASLPLSTWTPLNTRILKYTVKRYTMRRGALMFGKMLPVGIGAAVGGAGNCIVGNKIVRNARNAFGTAPSHWPTPLVPSPTIHEAG